MKPQIGGYDDIAYLPAAFGRLCVETEYYE